MSNEKIELTTKRLLLRPFRVEDVDDVFEYAKDPEWGRFFTGPYTHRQAEEAVAHSILRPHHQGPVFAVVLGGKVIGSVNFEVDTVNGRAELGYSIAVPHWGKGLATEGAKAVLDLAFKEYAVSKVYAVANLSNSRSLRVMDKLGMSREGILRSHSKSRDGRADDVYYGILREEWEDRTSRRRGEGANGH